jgi:hypothetical protein
MGGFFDERDLFSGKVQESHRIGKTFKELFSSVLDGWGILKKTLVEILLSPNRSRMAQ